ncbi:MAG TPA: hypothetical protein VF163_18550 [Micromonosporaceae bacterium]
MVGHRRSTASEPAFLNPAGLGRTLVETASRALAGQDCADLSTGVSAGLDSSGTAIEQASQVDADAVAQWVVERYPGRRYDAVVLGSPHGAAAELAVALGVPWLPASFEVELPWRQGNLTDPAAALEGGSRLAERIGQGHSAVSVRQVFDPVTAGPLAARQLTYHVRWCDLPWAYRRFLQENLREHGTALLLRDGRTWPVVCLGAGLSFQFGTPASGLAPDEYLAADCSGGAGLNAASARTGLPGERMDHAEFGVEPAFELALRTALRGRSVRAVCYRSPEPLSAAVADVFRDWLRANGKTGNRAVIQCGRLVDPYHVVRAGLVPYWCENAVRDAVTEMELWLAGSPAFTSIDILPEPPGHVWPRVASLAQWHAASAFASRRGTVERRIARAYPQQPLMPKDATAALRKHPYDLPSPPPLAIGAALGGLCSGSHPGLLAGTGWED